jgi:hypothetical protein
MVGQALNENAFGFGLGLVFCGEAVAEFGEFLGIFVVEQVERLIMVLAETVGGAVAGRRLLACFGSGSGGTLSVQLVGADLCSGGHDDPWLLSNLFCERAAATPNDFSLREGANGQTNFEMEVAEKKANRVMRIL